MVLVDDMFFASKIRATAEALGVEITIPRTRDAALEKAREIKPELIIADLHNQRFDTFEFIAELKKDAELSSVETLAFFSHVEVELHRRATTAGFDNVVPRSVFARDLPQILQG